MICVCVCAQVFTINVNTKLIKQYHNLFNFCVCVYNYLYLTLI